MTTSPIMPRSRSSAANIAAHSHAARALWTRVVVGLAGMAILASALLTPLWVAHAANNSVQGATKKEDGFESDAPSAILIEASSGSVLYEKNADQALPPSSMLKLITVEVVFNEIQQRRHQQQNRGARFVVRRHHPVRQRFLHHPRRRHCRQRG